MNRTKYQPLWILTVIVAIMAVTAVFGIFISAQVEPNLKTLHLAARDAYYAGDLEKAIGIYLDIMRYEPGGNAALQIAAIYEEKGDYAEAIKLYEQFLKFQPNHQQAHLDLAIAHYNVGNDEESEKLLLELLQSEDLEFMIEREAAYYQSKLSLKHGRYNEARSFADQALKADPDYAIAVIQRGWVYEMMGEVDEAISNYLSALRIDGSLKGVQRQLGLLYLKQKAYDEAYLRFDKAISENKNDQISKEKIEWLETEFPDRFKRSTTPPKPQDFPKTVNFKKVTSLENEDQIAQIRVGLAGGAAQPVVIFRVGADFWIKDQTGKVLAEGKAGEIWMAQKGEQTATLTQYPEGEMYSFSESIRIEPKQYAPILIHQVQFGEGYYWSGKQDRQYRGQIELLSQKQGIVVINSVNVEEYLYSVVASEMPSSWPAEALKVQAVAARTYIYYNMDKHDADGFDLCDTVHCTAYNGIAWESKNTRTAVDQTFGEIMTYNGRPINAVYSANSGGHTEDVKDVWGFELPYLKGVSTIKESADDPLENFPLEPADLKAWLRERPESYSADLRYTNLIHYRWQRRVSRSYIEDRLNIGNLQELQVTGRGKGGSVISIKVIGDRGEVELKSSLRSNLGGLRSNRFFFRPEYENGSLSGYIFYGGGWGHSAGMDQVAAAAMAKDGISYNDILNHFYTGVEIEQKY